MPIWGALPPGSYQVSISVSDATGLPIPFWFEFRGTDLCDQSSLTGGVATITVALPAGCMGAYVWLGAGATTGSVHGVVTS